LIRNSIPTEYKARKAQGRNVDVSLVSGKRRILGRKNIPSRITEKQENMTSVSDARALCAAMTWLDRSPTLATFDATSPVDTAATKLIVPRMIVMSAANI
jgi:hypothetical protein